MTDLMPARLLLGIFAIASAAATATAVGFRARARRERAASAEASLVGRALAAVRDAGTFSKGLEVASAVLCDEFGSTALLLAAEHQTTAAEATHRWLFRYSRLDGLSDMVHIAASERDTYFFPLPGEAGVTGVAGFQPRHDTARAVGANFATCDTTIGREWRVRWFVPAPQAHAAKTAACLLKRACDELTPALHNLYRVRRLRAHAIAEERARIARELHDSVVQSLIGLEMGVAAIAASSSSVTTREDFVECAAYVRDTLRHEIANVRDLMHSFRPLDVSGATLPAYLSDLADRFERDTGIRTTFVGRTSTDRLPRRWCSDVARVAQEALVNVRKHSGASVVTIELAGDDSGLRLRIDDNGRGFAFSGRLDDQALWHQRTGPLVIKERARAIGASLAVQSTPGRGASVEMSLPYAC